MARRPVIRTGLALGAALALALPAAAQARDIFVTDTAGNLHRIDSRTPGIVLDTVPVTGLPAGVSLAGIDVRPATGDLVGVGSNSVVYALNADTGAATAIGTGFAPGLNGTAFGVDTNPVPDALRITSNAEQNYRISFATGNHGAGSPDGALNPGDPAIVASAYTNSTVSAVRPATTTLFGIDATSNALTTQNPPNAGTQVDPKPLGVDVGEATGFDIAGAGNLGFLATTPAGRTGAVLYRVDITTGTATELGPIATGSILRTKGTPRLTVTGMAARQEVTSPRGNVAPNVQIVKTTLRPRPGQRAAYIAQAADPDGAIVKIEWDTDADGAYDDASGASLRLPLPAGRQTLGVRVTDERGARTATTTRVLITR
ncbi:MAG: DUF4394 domain-containing protein [Thermoleophilia bacterium]